MKGIDKSEWWIILCTEKENDKDFISATLHRGSANEGSFIDYEFSILSADGAVLETLKETQCFLMGFETLRFAYINAWEVLTEKRYAYLPRDTFTLQLKVWKNNGEMEDSEYCYMRTRPVLERTSLFGT
ncbi:hypothetical protein CEXT_99711 [Caerostris extrusa]|uniref:Uncharacterized protein n=1 Tax=Caerostris extrusa TaxID=172846 RepID=A0AAV4SWV0_CAEEX|nr:hypothetical protein CEXT_99711 [Caerostris extrusa]